MPNTNFRVEATEGSARIGHWKTNGSCDFETPGLLLYTKRGGMLNLTPDLRDSLKPLAQGCHLSIVQFLDQPTPKTVKEGGGVKRFLGMDGLVTLATNRDPNSSEIVMTGQSRQTDSLSVCIHSGGRKVSPAEYMKAVEALRPSAYVTMADDLPRATSDKRSRLSVERTSGWFKECLSLHQQLGLGSTQVFAPVVGGCSKENRIRASEAASASAADGYALAGFGCGESDTERPELLEASMKHLPPDKPRYVSGMGPPIEILEAVEAGADLFDCWYLESLVEQGLALTFPLTPPADTTAERKRQAVMGEDHMKMSMYSLDHRTDASPILKGCSCFACKNHTRSYIHHLLSVHEMLGLVLLEVHNTHHMLQFFKEVRKAIRAGKLAELKAFFFEQLEGFYIPA